MRLSDKSHITDSLLFSSKRRCLIFQLLKVISSVCVCLLIKVLIVQYEQHKHNCGKKEWARQDVWKKRREGSEKGPWDGVMQRRENLFSVVKQNNEMRLTEERFWVPFAQAYCTYDLLCWVLLTRVGFNDVLCMFISTEHLFCCIMHLKHN